MNLFWFIFGCGLSGSDTAVSLCDRSPPLSYENFGKGYMSLHCNGCHSSLVTEEQRVGAPPSVNFDSYQWVLEWLDRLEARATGPNPTMPPGGGPTSDEVLMFEEWIHCTLREDAELYLGQQ